MLLPLGIVDYCYTLLVDVHVIETGLSTQILRYFSKEQTSNYNPMAMCCYAVCYSFKREISQEFVEYMYSM
jgi:hypothetical protein